jgi:UDP-GlcNAc:undecaprenyl-phosphate GlcNAc-1-phosphate transferase
VTLSLVFSALTVGALLLTSLAVPLVRRLAQRTGLVDHPSAGAYKTHVEPTPYGGGLALWLGVVLPLIVMTGWLAQSHPGLLHDGVDWISPWAPYLFFPLERWSPTFAQASQMLAALACASLLGLLGLADDRRPLPASFRFGVQLLLAGLLVGVVPGFRLGLFGDYELLNLVISVLWIAVLTNAFNFLDNMNGLSAGLAAITIGSCAAVALIVQHVPAAVLCLTVLGACVGFLRFNFPRASIFMGDAGGLFLGFLGGALSILLSNRLSNMAEADEMLPYELLPLCVFAVPAYDLITVVGLRLRRGMAPWLGDTNHVSHRLVAAGLTRTRAVLVLYFLTGLTAFVCTAGLRGDQADAWVALATAGTSLTLFGILDLWLARRYTR